MKNILKKIYLTALRAIPLVLPLWWVVLVAAEVFAMCLGYRISKL